VAEPVDDIALGRAFLWGAVFSLIALIPLLRQVSLQALVAMQWSVGRSTVSGAGLALGLVFAAKIFHGLKASAGPAIGPGSDTILGMQGIHQAYGAWALLGFAVVLIPMLEEFVFRGVFLRVAARHLAFWAAAVVQAVAFVLWHEEAGDFPVLLAFAMIAAWLAVRSGGLLAPVTFHAVVNLIAISQVLQHGAAVR
jgi:membrane protease YdiL (CAAX protease family)